MAARTAGSWSLGSKFCATQEQEWNPFMFIVLKHCHVYKLGFDTMVFVIKVVYDLSSSK
jgi:hypothetical protein